MLVLPLAYAAPVSYYQMLSVQQKVLLEVHEHFPKQTMRNHCTIATAHGAMKLTIPLAGRKNKSITKDIRISYAEPWQKLHFKALETAYNNSPYFEFYNYLLEPFYKKEFEFLIDFNLQLTQKIMSLLKINVELQITDSYNNYDVESDLRNFDFTTVSSKEYYQVFADKQGFITNLSILDLLFNEGNKLGNFNM
jgi:WbqC-like protein family